ncbi:MAG: D-tyrosyl-tRNA(Tyr) deacylase [Lachnospiraceae bacterium]|nr:D-tyrosyl-tRNA(Tyr) deacylase [Lachnospiraceae bacterium]
MKFVIQRVQHASCTVDGEVTGAIEKGFLVLIGVRADDTQEIAQKMLKKMLGLRIFEDAEGKTNLDLNTVGGSVLLISQFTLYADCRKGNRPSFIEAAPPAIAEPMYEFLIKECRNQLGKERVQVGRFGADMKVSLLNDGPFTVVLNSDEIIPKAH